MYDTHERIEVHLVSHRPTRLVNKLRNIAGRKSKSIVKETLKTADYGNRTQKRASLTDKMKRWINDRYNKVFDSILVNGYVKIRALEYFRVLHETDLYVLLRKNHECVLLTSSGPAIMHKIGYEIKKRFPQVFWIADYRDQIVGNPAGEATRRMREANNLAIEHSDMITAVSEGLVSDIAKYSPVGKEAVLAKSYILYNGFASKSAVKPYKPAVDNQKIRIAYTGVLYIMRRIDYLIRAIREVNSLIAKSFELLYCGASSSIVDRIVAEEAAISFVINKGFVSKQEAEKEQDEADILLLLKSNEPETGGMTGKFFEYLERSKPILVLGDSDSEFNEIAKKIGGIYVLPYDEEKIKEFLIEFASKWPFEIERNAEEVDKFNWNNLAKGLIEEVEKRLKKRQFGG